MKKRVDKGGEEWYTNTRRLRERVGTGKAKRGREKPESQTQSRIRGTGERSWTLKIEQCMTKHGTCQ